LALASHLLRPAILLLYLLRAPEVLLRKALALQMLLMFVRSVYFFRALKHLGPMMAMLGKVKHSRSAGGC
jgi:hypothetical protein